MHFFQPRYVVKARRDRFLLAETSSGKSFLLIFIGLFLLVFHESYIAYPGVFLFFVFWTHQTHWTFDGVEERVLRTRRVLWLIYDDTELPMKNIVTLSIVRRGNANGVGHNYRVMLLLSDGKSFVVALRGKCSYLKPIISDIRRILPPNVSFVSHEDCGKKESFISF